MRIIAIQLANDEWYLPKMGETLTKDKSGFYVLEAVRLHVTGICKSFIVDVWSEKDVKEVLVYENHS